MESARDQCVKEGCKGCASCNNNHRNPIVDAISAQDHLQKTTYTVSVVCTNCDVDENEFRVLKGVPIKQKACPNCGTASLKLKGHL